MSGVKQGTVPVDAVGILVAAPVVLSLFAVAGTYKAAELLCQGAVRVSQKAYGVVQEKAAEMVKKEIHKLQQQMEEISRIRAPLELEYATPSLQPILENVLSRENRQQQALEDFLRALENQKDQRVNYEISKKLRQDVSLQLEEKIKHYQKQLASVQARKDELRRKKEEQLRKLSEQERTAYLHELQQVYTMASPLIEILYPEIVQKVRIGLKNIEQTPQQIGFFKKYNSAYQQLLQKTGLFKNTKICSQLLKVVEIKRMFQADPTQQTYLKDDDQTAFLKAIQEKQNKAEKEQLNEEDLQELREKMQQLQAKAQEKEQVARFEETQNKAIKALGNRGYLQYLARKSSDGKYHEILAEKPDGQKARVRILYPEISDKDQPVMHIEIADTDYPDEQGWIAEGELLAKEIESMGVMINFKEAMTHFKQKVRESAFIELQRKVKAKNKKITLHLIRDNLVRFKGGELLWEVGISPEKMAEMVLLITREEPLPTPERQKLKERND